MGYSPLLDGNLARPLGTKTNRTEAGFQKELKPSDIKIIERVIELAEKHSWKMSQVALSWSLTKISSPIVGANTVCMPLRPPAVSDSSYSLRDFWRPLSSALNRCLMRTSSTLKNCECSVSHMSACSK